MWGGVTGSCDGCGVALTLTSSSWFTLQPSGNLVTALHLSLASPRRQPGSGGLVVFSASVRLLKTWPTRKTFMAASDMWPLIRGGARVTKTSIYWADLVCHPIQLSPVWLYRALPWWWWWWWCGVTHSQSCRWKRVRKLVTWLVLLMKKEYQTYDSIFQLTLKGFAMPKTKRIKKYDQNLPQFLDLC